MIIDVLIIINLEIGISTNKVKESDLNNLINDSFQLISQMDKFIH